VKFVDQLKYLSIKLKNFQTKDRMNILQNRLNDINTWVDANVRKEISNIQSMSKYKYHGVVIPFSEGDDEDPYMVMSIIPELA